MLYSDWKRLHDYCMNKPCAYETRPFGETPICYRVAGKIFAQLTPQEDWFKITLKTNPDAAEAYRRIYPDIVVRGYHCPPVQQPYWNTLELHRLEEDVVLTMIDEAYEEVVKHLPKKEQAKLGMLCDYRFVKAEGTNPDFIELCMELDETLNGINGKENQAKFKQHNTLEFIHDVILVYDLDTVIGCCSYKLYDDETVEVKRVYLKPAYQGKGIAKEMLRRLEADARIAGFRYAVLETNAKFTSAVGLYTKSGYKVIPKYGPYVDLAESICMSKKL